ncbi:MAG: citrate/2-methylcitrate synthase, partial [Spirochaetia bacterium]
FDLCAYSTFEETSYLLLHGKLPNTSQLDQFKKLLRRKMFIPSTQRLLLSFPVESMAPMAALRLGTNLMRQKQTFRDVDTFPAEAGESIASDEDSIPMETVPTGEKRSVFQFMKHVFEKPTNAPPESMSSEEIESCYNLIGGVASVAAAIGRLREGRMPLEPLPDLSIAGNYLYMLTGRRPTPLEERIMDISFILHADHGMNASTFASMVVASTLSDIYFAIGSGIAALSGPLHGGANVEVIQVLEEIGGPDKVASWYKKAGSEKRKIPGFGHRVYKAYDPRARILGPLAGMLLETNPAIRPLFETAQRLETEVTAALGKSKKVFPNVDFYSGIVYKSMGISPDLYTTIFAVSRVSGWCARVVEYLENNRIFRPRAIYTGTLGEQYIPVDQRD